MHANKIKEQILALTKEYYRAKFDNNTFTPNKTYVNYAGRVFDEDELQYLVESSLDFWLTSGRFAETFEKNFSEYIGTRYCLLTNSGSSANLLALTSLTSEHLGERRLCAGDEVITVAACFPTTVNPIFQNNLVPIFCDIDLGTNNICISDLESAISENTKAIILAHTLGNPFNIDAVLKIKEKYNLWLIEDNCDALGSTWNGALTGTFGDLSTVSFYPPHHMTMGEGGAVLTDSSKLMRIVESIRDWGRDCWCPSGKDNTCGKRFRWQLGDLPFGYDHKYIYSHVGYNLKVTDMQAAVGLAQLKKLPSFVDKRRENFSIYYEFFRQYENFIILPKWERQANPSWFGFFITLKEAAPFAKNELVNYLEEHKVATRMLFGGNIIRQPAYSRREYRIVNHLTNTDLVMNNGFWIGVYPGIDSARQKYVFSLFEMFMSKY